MAATGKPGATAAAPNRLAITACVRCGCAALRAMVAKTALVEPRLDQLFAEPIVQQLMRRVTGSTKLVRQAAVARSTPRTGRVLALAMGLWP